MAKTKIKLIITSNDFTNLNLSFGGIQETKDGGKKLQPIFEFTREGRIYEIEDYLLKPLQNLIVHTKTPDSTFAKPMYYANHVKIEVIKKPEEKKLERVAPGANPKKIFKKKKVAPPVATDTEELEKKE